MQYKPVPTEKDYEVAERNGISKVNVDQRVNKLNWSIEDAITKPIYVSFRKKYKKFVEIAEKNGISYRNFRNRVNVHKWDPEEAATTPILTYQEVVEKLNSKKRIIPKEIFDKARKNGICGSTLQTRILVMKWDMDVAATKPVRKKKKKQIS
ncbi:hypothetical protein EC917_101310 [Bacillus thuringiensis]|uniref:Uncharacterized protein n=1 Tax=Bacillus thuringiensis TaxID=1428 RepID=A0A4R4BL74_BACTU|nr:hypothetical protein [Bacillus thuringiensis]TCW59056.1 hypothetical protein EC917_101310 [Bacillus thuringiensis]TCW59704.1 hypothetical protein EC910_101334 [Bacillus thuringiensis]